VVTSGSRVGTRSRRTTAASVDGMPGRPRHGSRRIGRATPYLFLAPYLVVFAAFGAAPVVYGVWISLHEWDHLLPVRPFAGLDNYRELIDPASAVFGFFWRSVQATGIFTLASVPLLVVLPLGLALLLNRAFPGRTFFRALYFAPYVLGVAVVGVLWRFVLDPNLGMVNHTLSRLGLPADTPWVTALPWAWISLVAMTVWWTMGFNAVIYLAGLQDIPRDLYDAATVDGANTWQQFRHVTLPGLRPVLVFVVITTVLASANMFGQAYVVTQGAPGEQTRTAIMYIAEEGLRFSRIGNAAAMSVVLALILAVVSIANFWLFRERGGRSR
jgi:multiple sugar transport system permease protein